MHMCVRTCASACVRVRARVCMCVHVRTCACICVRVRAPVAMAGHAALLCSDPVRLRWELADSHFWARPDWAVVAAALRRDRLRRNARQPAALAYTFLHATRHTHAHARRAKVAVGRRGHFRHEDQAPRGQSRH